jgi:putative transcriptional regulator
MPKEAWLRLGFSLAVLGGEKRDFGIEAQTLDATDEPGAVQEAGTSARALHYAAPTEKRHSEMTFRPIKMDRERLTIMGVKFPDEETLDAVDDAVGSAMYEGYRPRRQDIEMFRDIAIGERAKNEMANMAKKV